MSSNFYSYFSSPIGLLKITCSDTELLSIDFVAKKKTKHNSNKLCFLAEQQLSEYFSGIRKTFSLPIRFEGTAFEKSVWAEMKRIPFGKVVSYKVLAESISRPNAFRAVANACGKNKIPIVIPCHRVVAKTTLGGYSAGVSKKKFLLKLENSLNI